jgi:hypothetical protein
MGYQMGYPVTLNAEDGPAACLVSEIDGKAELQLQASH